MLRVERSALPSLVLPALLWLLATPAHAAPELSKGPYLMDARPRSIAVMFELSGPAAATVTVESDGQEAARVTSGARVFHEVVIDGLEPATAHRYRLEIEGGASAEGSFTTAPPPGEGPVELLVAGDNRTDAAAHEAVIREMLHHPADFVVNTGDMVADGSDEGDWIEMFEVQQPLLQDVPLFPTLGNHELYRGGVGLDSFLKYTRVPRELSGGPTYYGFTWGPIRFLVLDSNEPWDEPSAQRQWLETRLAEARADGAIEHVFVAVHHGPISSGRHGGHPGMIASGVPDLLREHGVSLVLSGHDHTYERGAVDGLKYIVTGGGGAPLYPVNRRLEGQLAFEPTHHFLRVSVDGPRVDVTAIRADGSEIERCGFVTGGPWRCADPPTAASPGAGPVDPGQHPAAFWATHDLRGPLLWAALGLGAVVALWLARRGGRATPGSKRRGRRS